MKWFCCLMLAGCSQLIAWQPTNGGVIINGSGDEATLIYNASNGNLTLRSETSNGYQGFTLRTGLIHFDTVKGAGDYESRFLEFAHPGFDNDFGGITHQDVLTFVLFSTDTTCTNCLRGTTDFGQIMVSGLSATAISNNWRIVATLHPSGIIDSINMGDMTQFGVVIVPEPSPILSLGILIVTVFGFFGVRRLLADDRSTRVAPFVHLVRTVLGLRISQQLR